MFPFIWDGAPLFAIGGLIGIAGFVGMLLMKSNRARLALGVATLVLMLPLIAQSFSIVDQAKEKRGEAVAAYLSKNYSLKVESNEDAYKLTGGEAITVADKNGKTLQVTMLNPESAHPKLQVQDVKILQQNR
jgi:hypothetical protein